MASVIVIAIAAFGIYVLSAYSVQRLPRQIVLRKLFGACSGAIARLVAAPLVALLVTLASALRHTLAAMRIMPAAALRDA